MADIKTKDVIKGTIKTLDKAAVAGERMKRAYIETKEKAERSVSEDKSAEEYASDKLEHGVDSVTREGLHQINKAGQKSVEITKDNIHKAKDGLTRFKEKRAEEALKKVTERAGNNTAQAVENAVQGITEESTERAVKSFEEKVFKTAEDATEKVVESSEEKILETAKGAAEKAAKASGEKTIRALEETTEKAVKSSGEKAIMTLEETAKKSAIYSSERAIKALEKPVEKTIKQSARSAGAVMIKTAAKETKKAEKSVKTAERTAKTTIKTTKEAAKAAQNTIQAAEKTVQRMRRTAKATAKAAKATAKAIAATIRAIIEAIKGLIALIIAGGWIVIVIILIICIIGMIVGSVYGIFFSEEDSGTGISIASVVQEINDEYDSQIETIKNSIEYDVLDFSESRAVWKDVLAIYAVKVNSDPDNPQEVATMDESKKQMLKEIFWKMNTISYQVESETETVIVETVDEEGNIIEIETPITITYLYITVSHKTIDEMAQIYGFSEKQKGYLTELLNDKNNLLWAAVLREIDIDNG